MNKQQLAAKIWESANKMRSKIEANDYKDYILGFIFYKFLSEQELRYMARSGATKEELPLYLSEAEEDSVQHLQGNIGYFISYENLFSTWIESGSDFDIGNVRDALSAFARLIGPRHKKVFDGIFDTLQTGLSKLGDNAASQTKAVRDLIYLIKDIPMDGRQDYDVLGFIYEYLISNFAANAGKKAGEFYTPHEVSLVMSEIVADHLKDKSEIEIYDPTSGSGSLLLNIGTSVAQHIGDTDKIKYYAQELKQNTYNLTRMNLVMRGIKPDNIVTRNADTLEDDWPYFDDSDPVGTYDPLYVDAVVSNPPYSQPWEPDGKDSDPRYSRFGIAPKSKADYAFLLHDLYHLRPDGIMTIVLPHGVLFRGGEEGQIRKNLIENNHIDAIIGLPANIFFGTGIPTIVMVLKQKRENTDVLVIDASKGFVKDGKNNKLRASDIRRIVDTVTQRRDLDKYARRVQREEIRKNDYNLNIPRYVDSSESAETWDLYATMFGGIPVHELDQFAAYWDALPGLRDSLFDSGGGSHVKVAVPDLREAVNSHPAVARFRSTFESSLSGLDDFLSGRLIKNRDSVVIAKEKSLLTEDLFGRLAKIPLVDEYAAFQLLHEQWETIELDLEMIQSEGAEAITRVEPRMVVKKQKGKDVEVQDGWTGRILPFVLVQQALLQDELAALTRMEQRIAAIGARTSELLENLSEEDKAELSEVLNDDNTAFMSAALAKAARDAKTALKGQTPEEDSTYGVVIEAKNLLDEKKSLDQKVKLERAQLLALTKTTIENLSEAEIDDLLQRKWISPLVTRLIDLPANVLTEFAASISRLAKKYETTLSDLDQEIRETEAELAAMLGELTGSDDDLKALEQFRSLLGGH